MQDPNARLLAYLRKLGAEAVAYRAAHLHVSLLPAPMKTRENVSRAISVFNEVRNKYKDGEVFVLKNFDIVFVTKDISKPMLAGVCDAVRQIFIGHLDFNVQNVHGQKGEFFTLFELTVHYQTLLVYVTSIAGPLDAAALAAAPNPKAVTGKAKAAATVAAAPAGSEFLLLQRVKDGLQHADGIKLISTQSVYSMRPNGQAAMAWQELYISVKALEDTFCPGQSLTASKWLFNDLTEEMDALVLRALADPTGRGQRRRMSLNVNLSTLASPKFLNFDAELPDENRSGVILEISKTDLFENITLYHELLPFLRERGYRLLIDGLTPEHIAALDPDGIPCDFLKLFWSGTDSVYQSEIPERMAAKIRARTAPLIVLARCDTADSLRFARDMGINMVQGRLIDHMSKKEMPF